MLNTSHSIFSSQPGYDCIASQPAARSPLHLTQNSVGNGSSLPDPINRINRDSHQPGTPGRATPLLARRADKALSDNRITDWGSASGNSPTIFYPVDTPRIPVNRLMTVSEAETLINRNILIPESALYIEHAPQEVPPDKYIVRRPRGLWGDFYGEDRRYSLIFDRGIGIALEGIRNANWSASQLLDFTLNWRRLIEEQTGRVNIQHAAQFGCPRAVYETDTKFCHTSMMSDRYKDAVTGAYNIPPGRSYHIITPEEILHQNLCPKWVKALLTAKNYNLFSQLKIGVVMGEIIINGNRQKIPLTYNVFLLNHQIQAECQKQKTLNLEGPWDIFNDLSYYQQRTTDAYDIHGAWMHPDVNIVNLCLPMIIEPIQQALAGNPDVIPGIHWWLVHLAPTLRGSGGIAELLVHTLFRHNGIDLPNWRSGLAPSIATLLEPDTECFCQNYQQLFANQPP